MKKYLQIFTIMFVMISFFTGCEDGGTEIIEDNPATLVNTVWAGNTPRDGDWLTISFKAENKVVWSFSFDNSSNEWEYSYNSETNQGTIIVSEGWNPAPNGFTIKGNTLTITNYGGHGGVSRDFKRYR